MKGMAVVFRDKMSVSFEEVGIPQPGEQDVVIDVKHSWISIGTESSYLRGERSSGEKQYQEGDPWPFPHIPGYQKVGRVAEVGHAVQHVKPGDDVFATVSRVEGMVFPFAGHVSPAVIHQSEVWKLPHHVEPIHYAGMVLTQVGYNCGMRPAIMPGEMAVVIGDGLVGQWTAQMLAHRGARVMVAGRSNEKMRCLPKQVQTVNIRETNSIIEHVDEKIAVVVDTVGALETVKQIQPIMKRNSHLVSAGFLGDNGKVDIQSLRGQEITLHAPSGWDRERMEQTLKLITEGQLQTKSLVSHRFSVEQAVRAWDTILDKSNHCLGVVLDWS